MKVIKCTSKWDLRGEYCIYIVDFRVIFSILRKIRTCFGFSSLLGRVSFGWGILNWRNGGIFN